MSVFVVSIEPSTCVEDVAGAVDAALEVNGIACEATLVPRGDRPELLGIWGSREHWASCALLAILDGLGDEEAGWLADELVEAVNEAAGR